jgi:hypothetical protein
MSHLRFLRRLLSLSVLVALGLPIVLCVVLGLARLLAAMGDQAGARVADVLALAGGVAWVTLLIVMVIVQALMVLGAADEEEGQ